MTLELNDGKYVVKTSDRRKEKRVCHMDVLKDLTEIV